MRRIGILGGSFNPVHRGHTFLAKYTRDLFELERVVFVPTGVHAFDSKSGMTAASHRVNMARLAVAGEEGLEISEIEVNNPAKSYTYNTLRSLSEEFGPDSRLYFITGTDEILEIDRWYRWQELLGEYTFLIGVRPGYDITEVLERISSYEKDYNADIRLMTEIPAPDISSTGVRAFIREICSRGQLPEGMDEGDMPVEPEVMKYIMENNLYRENHI